MQSLENKENFWMPSSDQVGSSMNESGTGQKIDTPLTQAGSPNVHRDLLVKRNKVGAESHDGRLLSNLVKQTACVVDDTGDRSWAKHETQTVEWMMGRQVRTA